MYLSIGEIWLEETILRRRHSRSDRTKARRGRLITLSAAMDQSPVAVMISNKEGRIEYVNNRFVHLTGAKPTN
jgi:sigma-B regulation protein RsbU (phosphoserine phosphatase)